MNYKELSRVVDSTLWYEEDSIKKLDELFDQYVPARGNADTVGGEIVRAAERIIYRYFNDGDIVGWLYGNVTTNGSDRFLVKHVPGYKSLVDCTTDEEVYEVLLVRRANLIVDYLLANPSIFEEPNSEDSRPCSNADELREEEQEDELYKYGNDSEEEEDY